MLISIDIPRSTGRSFRNLLAAHFGGRHRDDNGDRPLAPGYWHRRLLGRVRLAFAGAAAFEGYDCIHGHFVADKYAKLLPNADVSVWLRDPVERLASHYHFWKRIPDPLNPLCLELIERELTLVEFAGRASMQNVTRRFLGGRRLESLAFVGIVEDYAASLQRFARRFGIASAATLQTVAPEASCDYFAISNSERTSIERLNRDDMAIYEHARNLVARSATT